MCQPVPEAFRSPPVQDESERQKSPAQRDVPMGTEQVDPPGTLKGAASSDKDDGRGWERVVGHGI